MQGEIEMFRCKYRVFNFHFGVLVRPWLREEDHFTIRVLLRWVANLPVRPRRGNNQYLDVYSNGK